MFEALRVRRLALPKASRVPVNARTPIQRFQLRTGRVDMEMDGESLGFRSHLRQVCGVQRLATADEMELPSRKAPRNEVPEASDELELLLRVTPSSIEKPPYR